MGDWRRIMEQAAARVVAKAEAAVATSLQQSAAAIRDTAKSLAPVISGELRDATIATPVEQSGTEFRAAVINNCPHADDVEFGDYSDPEVQAGPQPFMRNAAAIEESRVKRITTKNLKDAFR